MDDSYTVGRLTLDAGDTLNLANNIDFTVTNGAFAGSGALVNNGTINFNSTGSGVYLHFNGAATLAGTGTINLTGVNDRIFAVNAGDQITVGSGVTVAGTGNLGNSRTTFINQGFVTANQSGNTLTLQLGAGYTFTNAAGGTARAENGSVLALSDGTFSGGTFTALAGSQVRVNTGATVSGATLASSGTGAVTMDSATLANTTLSGSVSANDNADVTLADTLTNDGNSTLNSTGSGIYLHLAGAVTLATDSLGTLTLVGPNDRVFANHAGDRLTINGNVTVQGVGNLGNGSTVFTNSGTIRANVSGGTLTIQPGGGTADFTNNSAGTLLASNGGTLVFNNGDIEVEEGSTFSVPAGALTNLSGTTLTGGRYLAGSFDASRPATLSLGGGSIVTNNAAVELDGAGAVFSEINALATIGSSGSLTLGQHNFTTAGALTNAGNINVISSTLTVSGALTNPGTTLVQQGGTVNCPRQRDQLRADRFPGHVRRAGHAQQQRPAFHRIRRPETPSSPPQAP